MKTARNAAAFFLLFTAAKLFASDFSEIARLGNSVLYVRAWKGNPSDLEKNLKEMLPTLLEHPLFKDRLPRDWDILVDGEWKTTSAYWASDLVSPRGKSAVLIKPEALMADRALSLLTHELTHLLHYQYRPKEESWVKEGVAMLAEFLITKKLNPTLPQGFANPETSLTAHFDPNQEGDYNAVERSAEYAHILLYFNYLNRVCGSKDSLFTQLLTSSSKLAGIEFIDETLKTIGKDLKKLNPTCSSFEASFQSFEVAKFIQDPSRDSTYVLTTSLKTTVRDEPQKLLPYSAAAYKRAKPEDNCEKSEVSWGKNCIQIRMK